MKKVALIISSLLFCAVSAHAQQDSLARARASFAYDLNFRTSFDNREYAGKGDLFSQSMTIFGARLTPLVGVRLDERRSGASHLLLAGVDVRKDFGASPISALVSGSIGKDGKYSDAAARESAARLNTLALFREVVLYYDFERQIGKTGLGITAGIIPREKMGGEYGEYVFSDSLKFYDPNIEGLLISFRRPKSYYELGCDWMGQIGTLRRERFMVFTAGWSRVLPWMKLGYAGYMLHYANSAAVQGLMDNILVNPYIDFDFGSMACIQRLSLTAGWIQGMQRDRKEHNGYTFPCAADVALEVRNWNVSLRNELVAGKNLMPFYLDRDRGGVKYGYDLYPGDPFYRITAGNPVVTGEDGKKAVVGKWGVYDRIELAWAPHISDYLRFELKARFHFAEGGYQGCQQVINIAFDLERLLSGKQSKSN